MKLAEIGYETQPTAPKNAISEDRMLALARRFAELTAAQRMLFLQRLEGENIDFNLLPIPSRHAPNKADAAEGALPASYAQARLWFLWRLEPDNPTYNLAGRLKLTGKLDTVALAASVNALVGRHESLRTTFSAGPDGAALQQVHPPAPLIITWRDCGAMSAAQLSSAAEAEGLRPFDLVSGPLLRVMLMRCSTDQHLLLLTAHHIVSDGWSSGVLLRELAEGYRQSARAGSDADWTSQAALPIQYPDFALWQRRWLEAGEAERQCCWWQKTLGATHPALNLPTDRPRLSTLSGQGARHTFNVSARLTERLRAMAREQGATLFMVLLASFKALLYRYSGQGDIRVGVPVAGRNRAETEALIGFFINTLVVRTCPYGQQAFSALLSELKEALLGAEAHQDLPFEQLVEALQEGRSASHHPLFQVMANHQKRGATPQWSGLIVEEVSEGNPVAKFDLTLSTEERADGMLFGAFVYASDLFDAATIVRLTAHFLALLEQVAHRADLVLDQLVLLSPVEQARIFHWNVAAAMPLAPFVPIHVALAAQWQVCDIALSQGERRLSWGEFELRANRLAHALIASGVGAEVRVGISIERSPEMMIGLLAILKSGGTFVPLDPGYPAERLAFMVADAGVRHLVTQRELAGRLPELVTLYVDDERADLSDLAPDVVIHPAQSAYLIYTSGSTGQPKGVIVEHGPLARHCQAIGERYRMRTTDRVLHFASINFDLAHEYWLMPLLFGARLIITDPVLWSPAETCDQMARHGVTVAAFPPSYLVQLAEAAQVCPVKLRVLAFGGEALSCEHFDMVRRVFAPATLINGYGPTETVISPMLWITDADTDPAQWQDNAYLPIGTPVGARSAYVLDAALNALPVGVAGELYLGGPLLARGYHARAGMTAERFIPDPFSAGGRLYRTGDRARWRADGSVDYLGRLDHQVKLRGLRIEPGEIEAQLLACPGVREAAVLVQGEGADAQLVAYLVADGVDLLLLKEQLGQRLPYYMVPSQWLVLAQMPVTANGKLDRRALPVPTSKERVGEVYRAPQSPTEITLATIWAEVLKLERVGLDDHFFALGGHSLLATQICARIGSRMGLVVPLGMLFQTPVLGEFAARVVGDGRRAELIPIPRRTANTLAPLSFAQQGLWLLWQLDRADCGWNIASAHRWRGALDVAALQAAFDALVLRHAALRTSFPCGDDGVAMQLIDSAALVAIEIVTLSRWPHAEREAVAHTLGEAEAMQPFNLETGPLLRVRLIQIAPDDHVLLLTMHHIVADGWSCGLIFDELMAVYRGHQQGLVVALPALGITYADYAYWQRGSVPNHVTDTAERAYWRAQLGDAAALILPAPDDAPRLPGMRGEQLMFALEAGLVSRARSLAQECGATLSMLLQAAFHALLYRHTGQADHCIGILSANRDRVETEALVGLFLNPQVLRAQIDPGLDFMALIKAVRETLLGAQAHAGLSFGAMVEELRPQRKIGRNPLFQVLYNFMRPDRESFAGLPGIHIDAFAVPRRKVVFDLEFDVVDEQNGAVRGAFSYAVERVDADFVEALWDDYPRLLAALVAASDSALAVTAGPMRLVAEVKNIPDINLSAPALISLHPQWEAAMTQLWMRVLGVTVIGRHDNFFALGGSSLLALAVVAGARRQGMGLGVADLFLHQTIAELAELAATEIK